MATLAGNIHTRSVDTKRRCDLQDTPWWYSTALAHTVYSSSRPSPTSPFVPFSSLPHTCSTCLYVKLEVLVIVWCGGRLTFRNVSSTPLSAGRVKERRGYIGGREKNPCAYTIRARYIRDIWRPLLAVVCCSNSSGSVRACICSKKKGTGRVRAPSATLSFQRDFWYNHPLPPPSNHPLPSCEVERPFEICRWPKNAPEECALAWPRIRDSYLLTESSQKEGVIERRYYFVRTSSAATASCCEQCMYPAA